MTSAEILEQLQADIGEVLKNHPPLADAKILVDDAGDIETRVENQLGAMMPGPTGKNGLILIVLLPEVSDAEANQPGPPMLARCDIQVIEEPLINREETTGTLIRSSSAAVLALNALNLYTTGNRLLVPDGTPIKPFRSREGTVSHIVTMTCRLAGMATPERPGNCNAAWLEDDTLRLACATGAADIYYTTDGSYPAPANEAAILYTAPVSGLAVGTVVRAAGWVAGQAPGNVLEVTIVADAVPGQIYWNGWGPTWANL
jgi:hypothetical protein